MAACTKEPPPRTVSDFLENPILLEATIVRCQQNRSKKKYEAECVSAKQAANRLAAVEEQARKKELEEQSARKREALRRAQEARAEARRRAAEEERLRQEAEYLGLFEETRPEPGSVAADDPLAPAPADPAESPAGGEIPRSDTEPAPVQAEIAPPSASSAGDLESIRDELRRRQESDEQ
ncbi:MAG: EexN family lipoprotein [Gammaproteobacteria bacterium]|nr:EexN family lipoprotein [Gammaproteobacteria bacterium]